MARKTGADVTILERTDMILGTGLVGGIMRNNGRFTAAEEMTALGAGELFAICDRHARHTNVMFPGHDHASLCDIRRIHDDVLQYLMNRGVTIVFQSRITGARVDTGSIVSIEDSGETVYDADVFIDATGTAGPVCNCSIHGRGCAMCVIRCPSFGDRVSLVSLAGVREKTYIGTGGRIGAMSGSCDLLKESLSRSLQEQLNRHGVVIVPVPPELRENYDSSGNDKNEPTLWEQLTTLLYCRLRDLGSPKKILPRLSEIVRELIRIRKMRTSSPQTKLSMKVCQQYALPDYLNNIVLLDTGNAKMMAPYYNLEKLRKIPGFEQAQYAAPIGAGKGNSMRFLALSPRDNTLNVRGIRNLFCCGEKVGLVGHTEAIVTGTLAGFNSVETAKGKKPVELPGDLAVGNIIAESNRELAEQEGLTNTYTFSGAVYFERMKQLGLYTTDRYCITRRVKQSGARGIFQQGNIPQGFPLTKLKPSFK
jgi:hypothetical protein